MTYPDPEFPIGHVVHNRLNQPLTVVGQRRTDQIMTGGRRLFSDEDAKSTPWFYTLRDTEGRESSSSQGGLQHMEKTAAARRAPVVAGDPVPPTQRGMLNVGERIRSPRGTWTVAESWIANKPGAQGKDRRCGAFSIRGDYHMYYLLTHADGHQEEWSAPDMAGFHRILPGEQQTLTGGESA